MSRERTNATHASTTDPEAKLYKKSAGTEARLAFLGHALMENRCGLVPRVKPEDRLRRLPEQANGQPPSASPRWR